MALFSECFCCSVVLLVIRELKRGFDRTCVGSERDLGNNGIILAITIWVILAQEVTYF